MPRPPAPASVERIRQYVNTLDLETGHDELGTPADAGDWLARHGLPGGDGADQAWLVRLVAFRERLRTLLAARSEDRVPDAAVLRDLATIAGDAPLVAEFCADGTVAVRPAAGSDPRIAFLLADVIGAVGDGSWARLKVCANDACRWAFWDGSRNHSGVWCAMAVCGNRAKGRAFRERSRIRPVRRPAKSRADA